MIGNFTCWVDGGVINKKAFRIPGLIRMETEKDLDDALCDYLNTVPSIEVISIIKRTEGIYTVFYKTK